MMSSVSFWCYGDRLAGDLHQPAGEPKGAVVLTSPLTSVKEQATGAYAASLAERGWMALSFDHRGFGGSGGAPRQFESPRRKVEDVKAAVSFLKGLASDVGPVVAVGVCAGGGYMAQAVAEDSRIAAFAGVAGYYAAPPSEPLSDVLRERLVRARAARAVHEATGEAELIPAVGLEGEVAMPLAEAFDCYGTVRGGHPNYRNAFAVQSREETLLFDAQGAAPRIRVPTLVLHSEAALAPQLARAFHGNLAGPKRELWLASKGQVDFYDDPALIAAAASAIDAFFVESRVEAAS